jgi:predicted heme/steroid binding protein
MENSRTFTPDELSKFDGKEGRPAYVAYNGKVYDVTEANLWSEGNHMGEHNAGKDLTQEMEASPHGNTVVENMKIVGVLS